MGNEQVSADPGRILRLGLLAASVILALAIGGVMIAALGRTLVAYAVGLSVLALPILVALGVLALDRLHQIKQTNEMLLTHFGNSDTVLRTQNELLRDLVAMSRLTDNTKSLLYSDTEIEAVRERINAMQLCGNDAGTEALLQTMENRFGLTGEAQRLRTEIASATQASTEEKIDTAIERIHVILSRQDWTQAKREGNRLLQMFPGHPKVAHVPKIIRDAWNAHKTQILKEYQEVVGINNVERSIELLKELDHYLTPAEGAALAESARDVFKKKLHNYGVRFAIAVADQQWGDAIMTGQEIMREHPNSRMAREVREKMPLLQEYASIQT